MIDGQLTEFSKESYSGITINDYDDGVRKISGSPSTTTETKVLILCQV